MFQLEKPINEPVRNHSPNHPDRQELANALDKLASSVLNIPCVIGGEEIHLAAKRKVRMPHDHSHVLAEFSHAGPLEMEKAVLAAAKAKPDWQAGARK